MGCAIGLLVLFSYAMGFQPGWRLLPDLPAVHPCSAICLVLLGYGLLPNARSFSVTRGLPQLAIVGAIGVLLLRLSAPFTGYGMFNAIIPFQGVLAAQAAAGKPIKMGTLTACTLLAIAVAQILRLRHHRRASQIIAFCSNAILLLAAIGYIDRVPAFYGAMAPLTFLAALALSMAVLAGTMRHGFMVALTARSELAHLARLLIGGSTIAVLLIGFVLSQLIKSLSINKEAGGALLAYQTAAITLVTWVLVALAAARSNKIDRQRRRAERALIRIATTDALTGLLSRNRMLELQVAGDADAGGAVYARLFVDLDRFRLINEVFGQTVGDQLLVEVGHRLSSIAGEHSVGRAGGDEFIIYCRNVTPKEAEDLGAAVIKTFATPFEIKGHSFRLTASVGIANTDDAEETGLQQAADSAMYVAKCRGGNQAVTFMRSMHNARKQESELEQALHEALKRENELTVVYQPIVRVSDRKLFAVEALVRWNHGVLGEIEPQLFIPLAEKTGLIVALGLKLMALVVQQAALWRTQYAQRCPTIFVNVSPSQLSAGDLMADFAQLLRQHDLPASGFCIEVTEGAFTDERAVRALEAARLLGFKVAMDDFGVGYSSLSQLPRLPIAMVKLDRSFILNAATSGGDATMLAAIVQLAHGLDLTVIAEGVENTEQFDVMKECGCDAVQGYLLARPQPPEALDAWLLEESAPSGRPKCGEGPTSDVSSDLFASVGLLLTRDEERELVRSAALQNGLQPVDMAYPVRDAVPGVSESSVNGDCSPDGIQTAIRGMQLIVTDGGWAIDGSHGLGRDGAPLVILVRDSKQVESGDGGDSNAAEQDAGHAWVLHRPLQAEAVSELLRQAAYASRIFATRHHAVLQELHRSRRIFDSVCNGITIADACAADLPLIYVNPSFERMTGYRAHEVCGGNCRFLQGSDTDQPGLTEIRKAIREKRDARVLLKNYRKDGTPFWNELYLSPIVDLEGCLTHFVGIQNDVTAQVESAQRLDYLAHHDALTGLANRGLLMEQMKQALLRTRRSGGILAVLFFDIDNFKHVNDVFGHDAGDTLLQVVAERLKAETRASETVARLGGDEFIVLLEDFSDERQPSEVVRRIISRVGEEVEILGQQFHPSASVGVAMSPHDGDTPEALLKVADFKMYSAKHIAHQARQSREEEIPKLV